MNETALEIRMTSLENKMIKHLEESGEIRSDLKWLNKAFWTLAGAGLTFNITLLTGITLYLLNKK